MQLKLINKMSNVINTGEFQAGSIYKITLNNFMSYTEIEFTPGPTLNIIIGPNGTGKSSLVSAIILGLGGKPADICKSKLSQFINENSDEAKIEIELYQKKGKKNMVVTTVLKKPNTINRSINNNSVSRDTLLNELDKYKIQVSNLCQVLPQLRVHEFSSLTPTERLLSTLTSVSGMSGVNLRNDLIEMSQKLKDKGNEKKNVEKELQQIVRLNERDKLSVDNMKKKEMLEHDLNMCRLKQKWLELPPLEEEIEKLELNIQEKYVSVEKYEKSIKKKQKKSRGVQTKLQDKEELKNIINIKIRDFKKNIENIQDSLRSNENKFRTIDANLLRMEEENKSKEQNLNKLEAELEKLREDRNAFVKNYGDENTLQNKVRSKYQQIRSKNAEKKEQEDIRMDIEYGSVYKNVIDNITTHDSQLKSLCNQDKRRMELLKKHFYHTYQALEWFRNNRNKFAHNVYEPMLLEITFPDESLAPYLENTVSNRDLTAFSFADNDDMELFLREVRALGLKRVSTLRVDGGAALHTAPAIDALRHLGFSQYISDTFEAPADIKQYLCDNYNVHKIPIGNAHTSANMDHVPGNITVFFTDKYRVHVKKSVYSNKSSKNITEFGPARLLGSNHKQIREVQNTLKSLCNQDKRRMELLKKHFYHTYQALEWFRNNRNKFAHNVYEPMLLEITFPDESLAPYLENTVSNRDLTAFSFADNDDMELFRREVRALGLKRVSTLRVDGGAALHTAPAIDALRHLGFSQYISDTFEAPADIKQYLCDNYNVHKIPIGNAHTSANMDHVPGNITVFFTDKYRVHVKKSVYSNKSSKNITEFGPARLLGSNHKQIREVQNTLKSLCNQDKRRMELLKKHFYHTYQALEWFRNNRNKFAHNVYEPMLLEITFPDESLAPYLENTVSNRDLTAFSFADNDDMELFRREVRALGLKRVSTLRVDGGAALHTAPAIDALRHLGFSQYISDTFEAPADIKQYLCDNYNVHKIPIGNAHTSANMDHVPGNITVFFTDKYRVHVKKSVYSNKSSKNITEFGPARLLGSNHKQIREVQNTLSYWTTEKEKILIKVAEIKDREQNIMEEINALESSKNNIENYIEKLKKINRAIKDRTTKVQEEREARPIDMEAERVRARRQKADVVRRLVTVHPELIRAMTKLHAIAIYRNALLKHIMNLKDIIAKYDEEVKEIEHNLSEVKEIWQKAKKEKEVIEQKKKEKVQQIKTACQNKLPIHSDFPYKRDFQKLPSDLNVLLRQQYKIDREMNSISFDRELVKNYMERERKKVELRTTIESMDTEIQALNGDIERLKPDWVNNLKNVVDIINRRFCAIVHELRFTGEVLLDTGDNADGEGEALAGDVSTYGISVAVSFRSGARVQRLDGARQSGGERALATACYVLALQAAAAAPFKCLDEINQGMDATNERNLISLLIHEATELNPCQYFLLSPKLLKNLEYNDKVKVHVVMNGKSNVSSKEWKVDEFLKRARLLH